MLDETSFEPENLPIPNLKLIDPLGEIRHTAKELWVKDGRPGDKDVMEYWRLAENQMLSARTMKLVDNSIKSGAAPQEAGSKKQPAAVQSKGEVEDVLSGLLRQLLDRPMKYHEAICVSHILHGATINFGPALAIGPLSVEQIAPVMAAVPVEFDEEASPSTVPDPDTLIDEWRARLSRLFRDDEPFTNLDRVTTARMSGLIQKHPQVSGIVPRTQTVIECVRYDEEHITKQSK